MKIQDFLKMVGSSERINLMAICPDELGLGLLLQGALSGIADPTDVSFYDAEGITKEKARQIENEARHAPRGGSKLNHFFIYSLQRLPTDSAGPLLKAVEEARFSRFIFQAQATPRKIRTLMSRSSVVQLPFLSRKVVLGNMRALNHDAKTADQMNLYDGTLGGTIRALSSKETTAEIQREMKRGQRGLLALFNLDILGSSAFDSATYNYLTDAERRYLDRGRAGEKSRFTARQKLVLYRALDRQEIQD